MITAGLAFPVAIVVLITIGTLVAFFSAIGVIANTSQRAGARRAGAMLTTTKAGGNGGGGAIGGTHPIVIVILIAGSADTAGFT